MKEIVCEGKEKRGRVKELLKKITENKAAMIALLCGIVLVVFFILSGYFTSAYQTMILDLKFDKGFSQKQYLKELIYFILLGIIFYATLYEILAAIFSFKNNFFEFSLRKTAITKVIAMLILTVFASFTYENLYETEVLDLFEYLFTYNYILMAILIAAAVLPAIIQPLLTNRKYIYLKTNGQFIDNLGNMITAEKETDCRKKYKFYKRFCLIYAISATVLALIPVIEIAVLVNWF